MKMKIESLEIKKSGIDAFDRMVPSKTIPANFTNLFMTFSIIIVVNIKNYTDFPFCNVSHLSSNFYLVNGLH